MIIRYKCNDFYIEIKEIFIIEDDDGEFNTIVKYVLKNRRGTYYNRSTSFRGHRFFAIEDLLYSIVITEKGNGEIV